MNRPVQVVRVKRVYRVRFWGIEMPRSVRAVSEAQAHFMAQGIGKNHGWKIQSIGRA